MLVTKSDDITVQVPMRKAKCLVAGASYTFCVTAVYTTVGSVVGGVVMGAVGVLAGTALALHNEQDPYEGAKNGGKIGVQLGAIGGGTVGGSIGLTEGASYTVKLYRGYSQIYDCKDTKRILQQFFDQSYNRRNRELGNEDKPRIICPITFGVMLYPARIKVCDKRHLYELSSFHELLKERNSAVCPECRVPFEAKHLTLDCEVQDVIVEVCREAFEYLTSKAENRLLVEQMHKDMGNRIQDVWDYIQSHPKAPLSSEIERKIANGQPLPTESILTIYPAFRMICMELNDANVEIQSALVKDIGRQRNYEFIDEAKYKEDLNEVNEFAEKNRLLFDFGKKLSEK